MNRYIDDARYHARQTATAVKNAIVYETEPYAEHLTDRFTDETDEEDLEGTARVRHEIETTRRRVEDEVTDHIETARERLPRNPVR